MEITEVSLPAPGDPDQDRRVAVEQRCDLRVDGGPNFMRRLRMCDLVDGYRDSVGLDLRILRLRASLASHVCAKPLGNQDRRTREEPASTTIENSGG
jgi:hypothetical protein